MRSGLLWLSLWIVGVAVPVQAADLAPTAPGRVGMSAERLELVANLLGPAGEKVVSSQRIVVLANLFQTLLLIHAGRLVQSSAKRQSLQIALTW